MAWDVPINREIPTWRRQSLLRYTKLIVCDITTLSTCSASWKFWGASLHWCSSQNVFLVLLHMSMVPGFPTTARKTQISLKDDSFFTRRFRVQVSYVLPAIMQSASTPVRLEEPVHITVVWNESSVSCDEAESHKSCPISQIYLEVHKMTGKIRFSCSESKVNNDFLSRNLTVSFKNCNEHACGRQQTRKGSPWNFTYCVQ